MRRWKCGRTKKTTISILPPSIQASCTSFQKKDRDWKKTDSRESPFSQTRITGFVDIILPFRRREKSPVLLCPGNGTVIPPEDDRIDFPSSYRETGPAAQQPRFLTTRKLPPPFLLPPLLQHLPHVPRTCPKYQTGTNAPRTIPPTNCQPGRQKEEQTTTSPPGTSHGAFSSTRQKIEGRSATPATAPRTGR